MKLFKNKKFLSNKKAYNTMEVVIAAAVLMGLLFVFFYAIFPIITGKQVPFLKGQTEYTTTDCDGDGVIGLTDKCPCSPNPSSDKGQCEPPIDISTKNCPDLCKSIILNAKK